MTSPSKTADPRPRVVTSRLQAWLARWAWFPRLPGGGGGKEGEVVSAPRAAGSARKAAPVRDPAVELLRRARGTGTEHPPESAAG